MQRGNANGSSTQAVRSRVRTGRVDGIGLQLAQRKYGLFLCIFRNARWMFAFGGYKRLVCPSSRLNLMLRVKHAILIFPFAA